MGSPFSGFKTVKLMRRMSSAISLGKGLTFREVKQKHRLFPNLSLTSNNLKEVIDLLTKPLQTQGTDRLLRSQHVDCVTMRVNHQNTIRWNNASQKATPVVANNVLGREILIIRICTNPK